MELQSKIKRDKAGIKEKKQVYKNIYTKESEKVNTLRLVSKNMTKWPKEPLLRFQKLLNLPHSWRI